MAWANPRTWIDGIRLSAAQMNRVSENLRQTAPAKAQAAGDLFFATARNAIARLPLGASGTFLRPGSGGLPEWGAVPTPITARGDLVIGDVNGNPGRLETEDGVRVMIAKSGVVEWEEEIFLERWWEHSQWWTETSSEDITLTDGDSISRSIIARDVSVSGTINVHTSSVIIRARRIILGDDVIFRSRNYLNLTLLNESTFELNQSLGGDSGITFTSNARSEDGLPGNVLSGGGGGGGVGYSGSGFGSVGNPGTDSSVSIDSSFMQEITRFALEYQGGGGRGGRGGRIQDQNTGGFGGGVILIAVKEVVRNGHSLIIDASGEDGGVGYRTSMNNVGGGGGGGGGGAGAVVIQDGTSGISIDTSGGDGGLSGRAPPGTTTTSPNARDGGDGGDGTSYLGTSFPT